MEPGSQATEGIKGPLPPHGQIFDSLPAADRDALLDWALGEGENFKPAKIFYGEGGQGSRTDPEVRQALRHSGVGPFEPMLRDRLLEALPQIMAAAGYRGPEPRSLEFELNAYGEGAHFKAHIDIPLGKARRSAGQDPGEDRLISAVYYFYREPKAFTGGALRLYRFGAEPEAPDPDGKDSVQFEPVQNSLAIFPSWALHKVERVGCPSGDFADFRFALNCWFCRRLTA